MADVQRGTRESERQALMDELDALEAPPHDGGLGDMLRAALIEQIERRLDVLNA